MPILTLYPGTPRELMRKWKGSSCKLGRSSANDIQFDQDEISFLHAMIERQQHEYWIRDLESSNGTYVNNKEIKESPLKPGDKVRLGHTLEFEFSLTPEEMAELKGEAVVDTTVIPPNTNPSGVVGSSSASTPPNPTSVTPVSSGGISGPAGPTDLVAVGQSTAMMPQGTVCPMCQTIIPFQVNFCPRCGNYVGGRNLPAFPQPMMAGPMGSYVQPQEAPGQGVGILPILAFLCGLSIIGFPFAIILGLVALSQIRKYGGFGADRTQATWGVILGGFWAVLFTVAIGFWATHEYRQNLAQQRLEQADRVAKQIAENEALVIDDLKGLARAQKYAKAIRAKDPNQSGVGSYLSLNELAGLGTALFNQRLSDGVEHGYTFKIRDPNEAGFLALAEPERYGVTGFRTFAIDATGVVRGQDLRGESFAQAGVMLPPVGGARTAFDDMDDVIASDVIAHARRLAADGQYELCSQLLDEVRTKFTLTKSAQELQALRGTIDPFIVEAQASTRYQKAQKAVEQGDLKLAVSILREVVENYPSYTKISVVTDDITRHETTMAGSLHQQAIAQAAAGNLKQAISLLEEIRATWPRYVAVSNVTEQLGEYNAMLVQQRDRQARELLARAEALEREGKTDEAMDIFVQIEKNFHDTEWARHIASLRPALQKTIREKSAEQLFTQAVNLVETGDYRERLHAIEQLLRNYAQTDYVRNNIETINKHHQKVLADSYRAQALEQMEQGRDLGALVLLEEATNRNPDLFSTLRDLFAKLYLSVGRKHMADGNDREALTLFRKYLALEPKQKELSPQLISQLNYAVARTEYNLGNYRDAMQNLIAAQSTHSKDPDYLDMTGMVHFELGNYEDSLRFFNAAVLARPHVANFHARRGYAALIVAMHIERDAYQVLDAFLRQSAVVPPPSPSPASDEPDGTSKSATNKTKTSKSPPPASRPSEPRPSSLQPTGAFATAIPLPASGVVPAAVIQYDPMAAQALRNEILDVIEKIRSSALASSPEPGTERDPAERDRAADRRMQMLRSGVELGNTVSALNQRVLDAINRKRATIHALNRMQMLFVSGNRDLERAIKLEADRSQELMEILKVTQQHEKKLSDGVPKICKQIEDEIYVMNRAYEVVENMYRSYQAQSLNARSDPTPMLMAYFSKLFDRRAFGQGIQSLREAAEIKAPLELYSIRPLSMVQPVSRAPGPASLPASQPPAPPTPPPSDTSSMLSQP